MSTQFHVLSFEGPDAYSMAGGLGTRIQGLVGALAERGDDVHLWFVGDFGSHQIDWHRLQQAATVVCRL